MSTCPHPLDPIEVEALASGSEVSSRPDAADHAARCAGCGEAVGRAERVGGWLDEAASAVAPLPENFTDRVLRIRPFSRAERWSLAVWRAPLLLLAALGLSGTGAVAGPVGVREQLGLAVGLAASLGGLVRASWRWLVDLRATGPASLEALSDSLRPTSVGWAALLLLLPAAVALRAVLVRAISRR
ncbi:MAG TPA: hypothetical protein VMR54_00360 [Thermoanaerobaculia bacterium]|nr:hypothetical protein [Thermoanaerobaculia bacterium]